MTVCGQPLSLPDCGGGGDNELDDGGVEVHHHSLWKVELLWLPQKVHPLLCFLCDEADVQLPLGVLGDDGPYEAEELHSGLNLGVPQSDGSVLPKVHHHLHSLQSIKFEAVLTAPGHQMATCRQTCPHLR